MTTTTTERETAPGLDGRLVTRVLDEGYGPGAWHGADLKAALAEVGAGQAYWRPAPGRHNVAEIALHHAYTAWSVAGRLGAADEPFALPGEDWFELSDESRLSWADVQAALERQHRRLAAAFAAAPADAERFDLALGITCHAVYHAGQVQLLKRLHAG